MRRSSWRALYENVGGGTVPGDWSTAPVKRNELDIISISEMWLISGVESSFIALDGYVVVRGDTNSLVRKHGSCLHIRETFRFVEVDVALPNVVLMGSISVSTSILYTG